MSERWYRKDRKYFLNPSPCHHFLGALTKLYVSLCPLLPTMDISHIIPDSKYWIDCMPLSKGMLPQERIYGSDITVLRWCDVNWDNNSF